MNLQPAPEILKADEALHSFDLKRRTKYVTQEIEPTDCEIDHSLKQIERSQELMQNVNDVFDGQSVPSISDNSNLMSDSFCQL